MEGTKKRSLAMQDTGARWPPSGAEGARHVDLPDSLTEEQRQAIELDQILGLSRTEAVRLAKCSPSQFAGRPYRAMRSLRRILPHLRKSVSL